MPSPPNHQRIPIVLAPSPNPPEAQFKLYLNGLPFPITNLSIHGFEIDNHTAIAGITGVGEGLLQLGASTLPFPINFRTRPVGADSFRCTLLDLSLDDQDAITNATKKRNGEEAAEFENLSYDQLAAGATPDSQVATERLRAKANPKIEKHGAIAAIICAIGFTAALIVIASIVLGKNSLEVYNGALVGNYLPISSPEEGTIAEMFVAVGDRVEQGDPLFRVYNQEQAKMIEDLQTQLSHAVITYESHERQLQAYTERLKISTHAVEQDIEIAKAELAQVTVDLKNAQTQIDTLAPLLRSKAISKIEYQTAVATRDSLAKQALVKEAIIERHQISLSAIADSHVTVSSGGQFDDRANEIAVQRDSAHNAVKEARRKIEFQNLQLANQTVHAADAGSVYTTYRGKGEFVKAGDTVVSLSLVDTNWAIGHLDADDSLKVHPGQRVHVSIPSINFETEGYIAAIGHRGVYSSGEGWSNDFRSDPTNIPIKVALPDETRELPSGLRLKMSVAVERRWPWQTEEVVFTPPNNFDKPDSPAPPVITTQN